VSRNAAGTGPGNEQSGGPYGLSADGRYVLFGSAASDLVPNDANNQYDLFRRDLQTGSTVLVSVNGAGSASGNGHSLAASMSSDGQLIAFESLASDLVSGDVNGRRDTFVRDLATGTTTLMSTNPGGLPGNSDSFVCCIAANGARVVFSSRASDLTANDFNGTTDVFAVATPGLPFGNGFEDGTLTAWSAVAL
jgi:Tol biopolymer transport system component